MKFYYYFCKLHSIYAWILCLGFVTSAAAAAPVDSHKALTSEPPSVLILGDSLSSGYKIDPALGWVALLQAKLARQKIVNASVSGETAGGGLARLPALLQKYAPDVVIVELGGNDGLRGYPLKGLRKQLSDIVLLAQQANAKVILVGMKMLPNYGRRYTKQFEKTFADVAKEHNLPLLPFFLEGVITQPHLMQLDGIHPNEAAQPYLLRNLWAVLEPILEAK